MEVKSHMFFKSINWGDVYNKRITPPFIPIIHSETSTDYFDKEFTAENPELTPPPDEGNDTTPLLTFALSHPLLPSLCRSSR